MPNITDIGRRVRRCKASHPAVMTKGGALHAGEPATTAERLVFSQSIVNSVREPLIVLDDRLRVRAASRSYYETFKATREETEGFPLYELGNRQWDVPGLRELLAKIGPGKSPMETYEIEHVFPVIGRRVMLLDAQNQRRRANRKRAACHV